MSEKKLHKHHHNEDVEQEKRYKNLQRKYDEEIDLDDDYEEIIEKFGLRRFIH